MTELVIAILALIVMTIAANAEAVASLMTRQRLRMATETRPSGRGIQSLLDPRRNLEAALLLGQALALAAAAAMLTEYFANKRVAWAPAWAVLIVVTVYLVCGQALPRALSAHQPEKAASLLVAASGLLSLLLTPLTAISSLFTKLWSAVIPNDRPGHDVLATEEDLRSVLEAETDIIEPDEREMIDNVLDLEDTPVKDIMVPRVDMVAVEEQQSAAEVLATITSAGHSRVPVYRETIDQIVGMLYAKDLLPYVLSPTDRLPMERLVRPVTFVPESKRIDDLLADFRRDRIHIALVVDEYGGTAGLVTIEDILEEIVGDIQDEYDVEPELLRIVAPGVIEVDGGIPLDDVEEALGVDLQDDDEEVTTAAGFVHLRPQRCDPAPRQSRAPPRRPWCL
ncbi:MAG: hemolysin family protein [Chloroflexota bacterium]